MSDELRALLVVGVVGVVARLLLARRRRRLPAAADGVNVVGYLGAVSGLGERARELVACLRAAGVEVSAWDLTEPRVGAPPIRRTTIAVVTAVQLASVRERCPAPFDGSERTIGYFFWELAEVPDEQRWGMDLVDEIWTPTRFVHDAYSALSSRPVRLVPLPVAEPTVEPTVEPAPDHGEPFVFLTSFDHRSVMARKNPIGAIEAFRRAFPGGDEQVALVVKTINGAERPDASARLEDAVRDDRRIVVRDESLDEHEHLRLIASSDAFVSLHRSEGLGLHLAEAMWLGTPVVATRYSGNLDLMDDACAALVDHVLVPVSDGDGAYPGSAVWADPDLDQAAAFMRRLVDEPEWRRSLVSAARARMEAQPSRAETGRALVALLGPGSVTAV